MAEEDAGPNYTLDAYENQIRNTVYAAYEDHDETEVHERLEGLLFEFREEYDPAIDSRGAFEAELDALVREAYISTEDVIAALESKVEELSEIGEAAEEFGGGTVDPESADAEE